MTIDEKVSTTTTTTAISPIKTDYRHQHNHRKP